MTKMPRSTKATKAAGRARTSKGKSVEPQPVDPRTIYMTEASPHGQSPLSSPVGHQVFLHQQQQALLQAQYAASHPHFPAAQFQPRVQYMYHPYPGQIIVPSVPVQRALPPILSPSQAKTSTASPTQSAQQAPKAPSSQPPPTSPVETQCRHVTLAREALRQLHELQTMVIASHTAAKKAFDCYQQEIRTLTRHRDCYLQERNAAREQAMKLRKERADLKGLVPDGYQVLGEVVGAGPAPTTSPDPLNSDQAGQHVSTTYSHVPASPSLPAGVDFDDARATSEPSIREDLEVKDDPEKGHRVCDPFEFVDPSLEPVKEAGSGPDIVSTYQADHYDGAPLNQYLDLLQPIPPTSAEADAAHDGETITDKPHTKPLRLTSQLLGFLQTNLQDNLPTPPALELEHATSDRASGTRKAARDTRKHSPYAPSRRMSTANDDLGVQNLGKPRPGPRASSLPGDIAHTYEGKAKITFAPTTTSIRPVKVPTVDPKFKGLEFAVFDIRQAGDKTAFDVATTEIFKIRSEDPVPLGEPVILPPGFENTMVVDKPDETSDMDLGTEDETQVKLEEEAIEVEQVEQTVLAPAAPLVKDDDSQPPPSPKIEIHDIDMLYTPAIGRIWCRPCLIENADRIKVLKEADGKKTPSIPMDILDSAGFMPNSNWSDLLHHSTSHHALECSRIARLSLSEREQLKRSVFAHAR